MRSPAFKDLIAEMDRYWKEKAFCTDSEKTDCVVIMQVLNKHLNPEAAMTATQSWQVVNTIVNRVIETHRHKRAMLFSDIELMQIATFINTCNRDV